MTDFSEVFDPSQYEGSTFDLLPIGIYSAQIIEAEVTVPQSNDGQGVKLVWQITEGEYEKRQVWQNITFVHSSARAQEIGRRELKDLCDACGITTNISNPEPFKFIPCKIRVGIKKDKDGIYDDKNVVTRVWPASYEPPGSRARPPKPQAASPKPTPSAPGPRPQAAKPQAASLMEGIRFTNYQPPNTSSLVVNDEVKAMIIALRTKFRLSPQEISEEMAKIDVKIPTVTIGGLLVAWGKYEIGPNGGGTSQGLSQGSSQPSPQSPTQSPTQSSSQPSPQSPTQSPPQAAHSDTPPWRDQS
jgi:hypothetical protein